MIDLSVDLMFLPYSASLHYLMGVAREEQNFGNTIYPGDWMTGAWIAADCAPILTLPQMQAAFHGTHTQHAVRVSARCRRPARACAGCVAGRL